MSKRIFVFLNCPTGSKPYIHTIYKTTPYLEQMFSQSYEDSKYMRKRDLERCGIMFPAGPRFLMLPYELPEHFDNWSPSGPDIFDIAHERYMKEQKEKQPELK
jgi:hypothetical protein